MKIKLEELSTKLSSKQFKFASGILSGKTQKKAYIDAGYKAKGASGHASRLATNGSIKNYIELSKKHAQQKAQETMAFDEHQWLLNQMRILSMAFGDTKVKKQFHNTCKNMELELCETNLVAANKAQELIARRMGWLNKNKVKKTEPISFNIELG